MCKGLMEHSQYLGINGLMMSNIVHLYMVETSFVKEDPPNIGICYKMWPIFDTWWQFFNPFIGGDRLLTLASKILAMKIGLKT